MIRKIAALTVFVVAFMSMYLPLYFLRNANTIITRHFDMIALSLMYALLMWVIFLLGRPPKRDKRPRLNEIDWDRVERGE